MNITKLAGLVLALSLPWTSVAAEPNQVTMNLSEFIQMYEDAQNRPDKPPKAPRSHALASTDYRGEVVLDDGEPVSAVFEARMGLEVLKQDGWVKVPLLPATVAVQSARISGKQAPLILEGGYYMLFTDKKGSFTVDLAFAVGVDTSQGSSGFNFQLVPSGATELELMVPVDEDLDFKVANARLQSDRKVGKSRVLEATLPATGALSVVWQRAIEETGGPDAEEEPRIYAEVYTLVDVGEGLLHARTTIKTPSCSLV